MVAMEKGHVCGPGWFAQGLSPSAPLSLATGPRGLVCQLTLLLTPCWVPNMETLAGEWE